MALSTTGKIEKVSIAPTISAEIRAALRAAGHVVQDLSDLTAELR